MTVVQVEGVLMNHKLETKTFDGNQKTTCNITLYQDEHDAIVRVKSDDLSVYEKLSADFDKGSLITLKVKVNAYQNNAYYKLIELVS